MKYLSYFTLVNCLVLLVNCSSHPPTTSQHDPDQQVLDELRKAGSDLNKPHKIDFYLYFPTKEKANTAAEEISKQGLSADVRTAATGSDWLCLGRKEMVPKHADLVGLRRFFEEITKKRNGEYDGWETAVVKE